ncbi:MAG TPA: YciI family protein [Chthoniobacterales bacterium]|nr:YciI family protein [Chthoniobacterales bacterium]
MVLEFESSLGHNRRMRLRHVFRLLVGTFLIAVSLTAVTAQDAPAKPKQFIYVLRLVPRLYDDKAWTKEDNMALDRHVARFRHAIETGELILAGRTLEPGDKTFGIAIYFAADETAARQFMESDPAVVAGLMTAELHPFAVVFERKKP